MNKLKKTINDYRESFKVLLEGMITSLELIIKKLTYQFKNKKMKLLKTILFALLIGMATLLLWSQTVAKEDQIVIEKAEISENSQKYNEMQDQINSCAALISDYQKEQQELAERNNLLRELFTQGKNHK